MKFKKDYDVTVPERTPRGGMRSEEYLEIIKFLASGHETMRFTYPDRKTAAKRRQSLVVTVKRERLPISLIIHMNELYVGKEKVHTPASNCALK